MNLYDETHMLLNQYGLKANKKLGQNFLINQQIIDEIIEKSEINENDTVLEIGPGLGSLTKALLKSAKRVIAVELDENMVNILKNRFNQENLEIINDDILKINIKEITQKYGKIKVVANLPYYITTPIIMKLLEEEYDIESITVMVQKEVGKRLCATPGSKNFGAISVSVNYYSESKIIIDVPKDNFMPVPEVDSCVVRLKLLQNPIVELRDKKGFFRLIKIAFSQRRKTINNSLSSGEYSKEKVLEVLNKLNIDTRLRAEDLSIYDFANIINELVDMKIKNL